MKLLCPALALALCMSLSLQAAAQPPSLPPQEAKDAAFIFRTMEASTTQGFAAIEQARPTLADILSRAPGHVSSYEKSGDGVLIRANGEEEADLLVEVVKQTFGDKIRKIHVEPNTYPTAAFLLAALAVHNKDPANALVFADQGLAIQPDNPELTSEKAMALFMLDRDQEAVTLVQNWLSKPARRTISDRARLLRAKGYGLAELGRYDEANEAYEQSLNLEPDHPNALFEIACIKMLRKGKGCGTPQSMTVKEAADPAYPRPALPPAP